MDDELAELTPEQRGMVRFLVTMMRHGVPTEVALSRSLTAAMGFDKAVEDSWK